MAALSPTAAGLAQAPSAKLVLDAAVMTWHARVDLQAPGAQGVASGAGGDACARLRVAAEPALAAATCQVINAATGTVALRWTDASGVSPASAGHALGRLQALGLLRWAERSAGPLSPQTLAERDPAVRRDVAFDATLPISADAQHPALARLVTWTRMQEVSQQVVVAIVDSGIDPADTALAALRWRNPREIPGNGIDDDGNGFVDDVAGWDFVETGVAMLGDDTTEPDNDPSDHLGHGTAVARVLAEAAGQLESNAASPGSGGVLLRLMVLRVASGVKGAGLAEPEAVALAIVYAVDNGAQVLSISLGSTQRHGLVADAVAYALGKGLLVVASAGNSGGAVMFPAAESGVLAVGATDASGALLLGSAQGPAVDLLAPGLPAATVGTSNLNAQAGGTSFAAPRVAAAAALLLAPHMGSTHVCAERRLKLRRRVPPSQLLEDWIGYHLRSTELLPPWPDAAAWAARSTDCGRPVAPLSRIARSARWAGWAGAKSPSTIAETIR